MSKLQTFTPKSRHLATEKNSQNPKIWAVILNKQSRQTPVTTHSSLPSGNTFGTQALGLVCISAAERAAAQRELNKYQESVPEFVPGSTDGAFTFSSPFPAQTGVWFGFLCMQ